MAQTRDSSTDDSIATEATEKPSQAEGERNAKDIPDADMGEAQATEKPSQAEGDRETIEEDIEEQK